VLFKAMFKYDHDTQLPQYMSLVGNERKGYCT